jgi:hypothetical protein
VSTVTDTVTYAERWLDGRPDDVERIDEDEARRRHESGELYTAVLGDPSAPRAYVDVRLEKGFVGVHFLDDEGRDYATYLFGKQKGDDELFLEQAIWREFSSGTEVRRGEAYIFKRDGTIHLDVVDYVQQEAQEGKKQDDVSGNWEPVPEFGQYDSIARLER